MRKQLFTIMAFCAACLVTGAQAQSSSDSSSSGSSGYPSSSGSSSGASSTQPGGQGLSPTGRMAQHEMRASQITGAPVTSTSGSDLGTISDVIINPASGRIDFAVISLSPSAGGGATGGGTSPGGTSSSGGTSDTSGTSGSSSSSSPGSATSSTTGGKQVAVPWMLLRPSSTGPTTGQPSFTFAGDTSKLASAPTFDPNTDLSQPGWRQSVFSYFGLSMPGAATGGAMTPGGTSGGTSGGSSGSSGSQPQ